MKGTVAWLDGRWGTPTGLGIPLSDRGLQLADGVFETVLIHAGRPQLLDAHHSRWCEGAALLGMAEPPSIRSLEPLIKDACRRAELSNGSGALRLKFPKAIRTLHSTASGSPSARTHQASALCTPGSVAMSDATPPAD